MIMHILLSTMAELGRIPEKCNPPYTVYHRVLVMLGNCDIPGWTEQIKPELDKAI